MHYHLNNLLYYVFLTVLLYHQSRSTASVLPHEYPSPVKERAISEASPDSAIMSAIDPILYPAPLSDLSKSERRPEIERRHAHADKDPKPQAPSPDLPGRPEQPKLPELPELPDLSEPLELPELPELSEPLELPELPDLSEPLEMPELPKLPRIDKSSPLPFSSPSQDKPPARFYKRPAPPRRQAPSETYYRTNLVRRQLNDWRNSLVQRSPENTKNSNDHDDDVNKKLDGSANHKIQPVPGSKRSSNSGSSSSSSSKNKRTHTGNHNNSDNLIYVDFAGKRHHNRRAEQDKPVPANSAHTSATLLAFDFHNLNSATEGDLFAIVKSLLVPRQHHLDTPERGPDGFTQSQEIVQSSWSMWLMCMQSKLTANDNHPPAEAFRRFRLGWYNDDESNTARRYVTECVNEVNTFVLSKSTDSLK